MPSASRKADLLPVLDPVSHVYTLEGRVVPGVTSILHENGFYEFPHVSAEDLAAASQRGRDVHTATELYDQGRLDWSTITDEVGAYLEGWVRFRDDHRELAVEQVESVVYHRALDYAGTVDRVFSRSDGRRPVLVDIKTGAALDAAALQTAAYQAAYNERRPVTQHCVERISIHLTATGKYRLTPHSDPQDFRAFCAALNLYHWRKRHDGR